MKYLIIALLLVSASVKAQVVNSMSPDKTGMYFYSLDSVVSLITQERKTERLILRADWHIISDFPDTLRGLTILKEDGKETKVKKMAATDLVVKITALSIIRDEVSFSIQTSERQGKELQFAGDAVYLFRFQYRAETQTYALTGLSRGFKH